ncbi:MAG: glycerophosphodiester phosphodiesterase [Caldilineaceae bacterium]|nr:glycerophosphodiester phosphodiesterase [Caldilineaceae bacterium]
MPLFGHRGAAGEAPENTLAGFAHAQRIGVRAFEFDVRLSADGELVVLHDESPLRTAGVAGSVHDFTVAQLQAMDARVPFPDWPEPTPIPTLAQVLQTFPQLDAYQIEIKRADPANLPSICRRLTALIESAGVAARVVVSSFDPDALAMMRTVAPQLPRAYIGAFDNEGWIEQALALGCTDVCIPHKTGTDAVVQLAHAHQLAITGWPGNSVADLRHLTAWRVANITTDYPQQALAFLAEQP